MTNKKSRLRSSAGGGIETSLGPSFQQFIPVYLNYSGRCFLDIPAGDCHVKSFCCVRPQNRPIDRTNEGKKVVKK